MATKYRAYFPSWFLKECQTGEEREWVLNIENQEMLAPVNYYL